MRAGTPLPDFGDPFLPLNPCFSWYSFRVSRGDMIQDCFLDFFSLPGGGFLVQRFSEPDKLRSPGGLGSLTRNNFFSFFSHEPGEPLVAPSFSFGVIAVFPLILWFASPVGFLDVESDRWSASTALAAFVAEGEMLCPLFLLSVFLLSTRLRFFSIALLALSPVSGFLIGNSSSYSFFFERGFHWCMFFLFRRVLWFVSFRPVSQALCF